MGKTTIEKEIAEKKRSNFKESLKHSKPVVATKNGLRLIEVVALGVVAGYTLVQNWHHSNTNQTVFLVAGLVIALRAAWEFMAYLTDKEA